MSSLYLCRDCSGAFHSMDELQRHEREEHDMEMLEEEQEMLMDDEKMIGDDSDELAMIKIKIEDTDSLSDTDSSHVSMNPTTPSEKSSGEKGRYECEDCHEMFAVKRELATHMRIHSGEQPHSCTQCGKEFGTRQLLKKHWMWHTGERSHVCPHCNKAFFQKGHLTQHLMIHSGGRPHECPQCHKTFIFKFDLNRHMKIHQERGFSCLQCGRSFLKQVMLDDHHLKCKGKPSSPVRSLLTPTMKAGLESAFTIKQEPIVLSPETIAKMAQKLLIQQQENQRSAFNNLLIKQQQENVLNNNNNNETNILNNKEIGGFEIPAPTLPLNLTCMLCKAQLNNQSSFTLHMYMYHIANQNTNLSMDSTLLHLPHQHHHHSLQTTSITTEPTTLGSDSDPATDTSCASSPLKTSPLQLLESSCMEQSSVSPSSSSGASPQPTVSESSTTSSSSSCKDCTNSWQRIQDLEQQVLKKDEEFENYKKLTKQLMANVSNYITTTQTPEKMFLMNAANVFTQIKNSL